MTESDNPVARIAGMLRRASIAAMLTGSFASAVHVRPRATQDVDFVIETDEPHLRAFVRSLPPDGYYVDEEAAVQDSRTSGQFNLIDTATGWKVDLMIRKSRPFSIEEFHRRQPRQLGGLDVDVVSAEDLVIAKLECSRFSESERQLDDVAAIVAVRGDELDRAYIERWARELAVESQWQTVTKLDSY